MTLADRIEALDGPDREVDVEIAKAVGHPHGEARDVDMNARSVTYYERAKHYTASLDAAMTLVPEGYEVGLTIFSDGSAEVKLADDRAVPHRADLIERTAATPALALCSAALRAMEASDGQ